MKRRLLQMNKWRKLWNILQVFRYKIVLISCNSAKKKKSINTVLLVWYCKILGKGYIFFLLTDQILTQIKFKHYLLVHRRYIFQKKWIILKSFWGKKEKCGQLPLWREGRRKKEKRKSYWRSAIGKAQKANTGKWLCRFRSWREKARLSFQSSTLVLDVPEPEWNDWN